MFNTCGISFVLPETRSVTSSPVPAPSVPQTSKASKPFGYGYPTLQPGYQNATPPAPVQPSNPGHHPGFQHYPQVWIVSLSSNLFSFVWKGICMIFYVDLYHEIESCPMIFGRYVTFVLAF